MKDTAFGQTFDSGIERDRYLVLRSRLQAGEIADLECHPTLTMAPARVDPAGHRWQPATYTPDFAYTEGGARVYEEVKPAAKHAPSVTRRDWSVRQAWASRVYPEAVFRTVKL